MNSPRYVNQTAGSRLLTALASAMTLFCSVVPCAAHTFTNAAPITIPPGAAPASPYPSSITVSGLTTPVTTVRVRIYGLSHTRPDDIDILLESPSGVVVLLLSDAGGEVAVANVDLMITDGAVPFPDSEMIMSGTYAPTNYAGTEGATDFFFSPAPSPPYGGTLSALSGTQANGTWNLYVQDDGATIGSGTIAGGWALTVVDPPLGTGFTYQGRLRQGGEPLNGSVDLQFTLIDGIGGIVGTPVVIENVAVSEGLFTVELNSNGEFGADAFDGEARFLTVSVANPTGSPFVPLAPPQPVTPAPYATTARSAFTLEAPGEGPQAVFVDDNGNVGIATANPTAQLAVAGGDVAIIGSGNGVVFADGSKQTTALSAPPIGSIVAWHKDFPNTPSLPPGWVECNGQLLSDAESPYDAQLIPDLNSVPPGKEGGQFLRGSTHSGGYQIDEFKSHYHSAPPSNSFMTQTPGGGDTYQRTSASFSHVGSTQDTTPAGGTETRPINMSVVWIMRVK